VGDGSRTKPVTLTDVAHLAGVSVPTASRVLNGGVRGKESGTPELRQRVEDAASALGYSVSVAAQAIKDGRARTIALIVSDIDDFGSATVIAGVMHAAEERGLSVAVRTTRDDAQRELKLLTQLRGERHRAIVLATSRTTDANREAVLDEHLRLLQAQGASVVLIGDSELAYPRVTVDNRGAAARLAMGLVDVGHRSFAVISGPTDQITSRDRVEGFLEGLAQRGITVPDRDVIHAPFSRDGGYEAVRRLGDRVHAFDAIAAMSDAMAVGAIASLRDLGIQVPTGIEVTGFDHVPMLGDVMPGFSTVEIPLEAFGEAAISLALDEADGDERRTRALGASTIVRGTVYAG
jgi:LacI family transcriptional regulator